MKAFLTRKKSIQNQYDLAMNDIEEAMEEGMKSTTAFKETMYSEVVKMIADDGYDVKIVKRANDALSYNEISWENAEEGKDGTITYIDETDSEAEE